MPSSSLLISTYNWPGALEICLQSTLGQSIQPGEIIICDDGSTADTEKIVQNFQAVSNTPVIHVWQKDEGFKLGQIRNKGIGKASGDYIIQIDGDLILHKHFVRDHLNFSKKNHFTTGSRVLLSGITTQQLIANKSIDIKKYSQNSRNFFNSLHIPIMHNLLAKCYKNKGKNKYYVKGCNMAFWKSDLLRINGYNEDFTGWGKEDSELAIRLINSGVKKQFLKFGAISYHLYHKEASRDMEEKNFMMMKQAIEKRMVRTLKGVDQYL